MIHKPVEALTEADILDLVKDETPEGKALDYKRDLPSETNDGKTEFIGDAVALANSAGGYILFGIEEDRGVPVGVPGVDIPDPDAYGLRLENMCRDNIEPRMHPLQVRAVPLASGRSVLAVRVHQSWQAPHRSRKDRHFYARNSKGKYPMDVSEIRAAMLMGARVEERISKFREARVLKVVNNKGPRLLIEGVKTILHLVPIESIADERRLNLNADYSQMMESLRPMGHIFGYSPAVNLDGAVYYDSGDRSTTYTQIFRNGAIESVFTYPPVDGKHVLWGEFESHVTEGARRYLAALRSLDFAGPVALLLSFAHTVESCLQVDAYNGSRAKSMHEPFILVPDFLLTDDAALVDILRQMFEIVWNAYGRSRPLHYKPRS